MFYINSFKIFIGSISAYFKTIRFASKYLFMMKFICWLFIFFVANLGAVSAQTKLPPIDKSPLDMSYYPNGYPVLKIQDKATEPLISRVIFSRPQKNSRTIFGDLIEYGKLWRLGANEATEIEFFVPVKIGGVKIKKGRYTLYCIPFEEKWTMILNRDTDSWGAFKYNQSMDVTRLDIPVIKQTDLLENFVMVFEKSGNGCNLVIAWDAIKVMLPISF
jgi:hypothetical protein